MKDYLKDIKPIIIFFTIEGVLLQYSGAISGYANNIYATNLGATDSQIGLIQLIPNIFACVLLIPLGVISDRMKTSRTMPIIMLGTMVVGYILIGIVPYMGKLGIPLFFVSLIFTVGAMAMYNSQWQAFFGDVTDEIHRNHIYAYRNKFMFAVAVISPLVCGFFINKMSMAEGKLKVLSVFFFIAAVASFIQIFALKKVPGGREETLLTEKFKVQEISEVAKQLFTDRNFLFFFIPVVWFYITWHLDWSMWYIGQTRYCLMDAMDLSIFNAIVNVGQFLCIGFIANMVYKKSPDYTLLFGVGMLIFFPPMMIFVSLMPAEMRPMLMTVFAFFMNIPLCGIPLCIVQMLLKVVPEDHKSLAVNIYTMAITLSNSLIPWLGVKLYILLGGDYKAFICYNIFTFVLRLSAFVIMILRYRTVSKNNK